MDVGAERHGAERHGVAGLRRGVLAGDDGLPNLEAKRREDVGLLTVLILDERDAAGAVGIVFDADDLGGHVELAALEVNQAVVAFVTTADVTAGDATGVVTATAALQGREKTLLRLALGDLLE